MVDRTIDITRVNGGYIGLWTNLELGGPFLYEHVDFSEKHPLVSSISRPSQTINHGINQQHTEKQWIVDSQIYMIYG